MNKKRFLLYTFFTLLALFSFSACGSGGGGAGGVSSSSDTRESVHIRRDLSPRYVVVDDNGYFDLNLMFTKDVSRKYSVTISDYDFQIQGCRVIKRSLRYNPPKIDMNMGKNSSKSLSIRGRCESDTTREYNTYDYLFSAKVTTKLGRHSSISWINFDSSEATLSDDNTTDNTTIDSNKTSTIGMSLTIRPSTLNATKPNESYPISVYVTKNGYAKEGVEIVAKFFNPLYGTLDTYTAKSDASGLAKFTYTSPDVTPKSDLRIDFEVANGSPTLRKSLMVKFNRGRYLLKADKSITVSELNTQYPVNVYLSKVGSDGIKRPAIGETIVAEFIDPKYGKLTSYEVATDDSGVAKFTYVSPSTTLPSSDLKINFYYKNDKSIKGSTTVLFKGTQTEGYKYTIIPDEQITVSELNQQYEIHVSLMKEGKDGIKKPAVGETIVAEFLMPMYGKLDSYSESVDDSGVATFTYTSPSNKLPSSDGSIKFYYQKNINISGETKLHYEPKGIDRVSNMYISPSSFVITKPDEEKSITIVTVNSENYGISTTVRLEQPNNGTDYGKFDKTTVTTNENGYATVTYTAPSNISDLKERNISIVETSQNINKTLNIQFNATSKSTKYEIEGITPNSFEVDSEDTIGIKIVEIGHPENVIKDSDVYEVNLTSRFTNMLVFDNNSSTYTYSNLGDNESIKVESKTVSGVAVIEVSAKIFDGEQNVTIKKTIPVTILSGPVTSLSLFFNSSSSDSTTNEYVNLYTIHAVDKYGNPAREGIVLQPSVINGTKVIRSRRKTGKIVQGDPNKDMFVDQTIPDFLDVNITSKDIMIITPNDERYDKIYIGKWSIDRVSSSVQLILSEDYTGATTDKLTYVIGNSLRYFNNYGVATVDIRDKDGNGYKTDENGNVIFELKFDPVLAGHTVTIAANAYSQDSKIGVSKITPLRWDKYSSTSAKVDNDGKSHNVKLYLYVGDGIENLIDVDIVPESISIDSAQCSLDQNNSDFHTDSNGAINLVINTIGNSDKAKECKVTWSNSPNGIYQEY